MDRVNNVGLQGTADTPRATFSRSERTLALCGVGGDAHSVGVFVLRHALQNAGFNVRFLGTQTPLTEICDAAQHADAVLISNLDGHARHYLADLPEFRREHGGASAIWYLGGNPALSTEQADETYFHSLGFDRVFLNYVSSEELIAILDKDLRSRLRNQSDTEHSSPTPLPPTLGALSVACKTNRDFREDRAAVLAQWPTGREALDLSQNAEHFTGIALLSDAQDRANKCQTTLVHPRSGVDRLDQQTALFRDFARAGADVLSFQIDSLTRNNMYAEAAQVIGRHRRTTESDLNGFPLVNHGVSATRSIVGQFTEHPFQVRHSTRDPRLLAEIAYSASISGFEGGPITYNLPYYRNYPIREALANWRYVDALTGHYWREFGVKLDREFFGVLTATLVPPCLAVAVCILEALLAAEAGVPSVSLGYAEQGCRAQDAAAIIAMRTLARSYLDRAGYRSVQVNTVFHQFMGAFPEETKRAAQLIYRSAQTAHYAAATRVLIKTTAEAVRIPGPSENVESIHTVQRAISDEKSAAIDEGEVAQHVAEIIEQVHSILDHTLELGEGSIAAAVALSIDSGAIDVPFSPSIWNRADAVTLRDRTGAVRFLEAGQIPIPDRHKQQDHAMLTDRLHRDGISVHQALERDIRFFAGEHWASIAYA